VALPLAWNFYHTNVRYPDFLTRLTLTAMPAPHSTTAHNLHIGIRYTGTGSRVHGAFASDSVKVGANDDYETLYQILEHYASDPKSPDIMVCLEGLHADLQFFFPFFLYLYLLFYFTYFIYLFIYLFID
jgi:hypothetical protein